MNRKGNGVRISWGGNRTRDTSRPKKKFGDGLNAAALLDQEKDRFGRAFVSMGVFDTKLYFSYFKKRVAYINRLSVFSIQKRVLLQDFVGVVQLPVFNDKILQAQE